MGKHSTMQALDDRHPRFSHILSRSLCDCAATAWHTEPRIPATPRHPKRGIMVLDFYSDSVGGFEWDMENFERLYQLREATGGRFEFLDADRITEILEEIF